MARVLLYSAGLDSYCLSKLYKMDILLFIISGTIDNQKERKLIEKAQNAMQIYLPLNQWELENKIIPYRNAFFVLAAAQYGNEIYIGATKGDTTKDKDYVFKSQMENILNYFAIDKHKVKIQDYPYTVHMPFKNMTKTEIVASYLAKGFSREALLSESRSCYTGDKLECGECRSCMRKYVALILNNIDSTSNFKANPASNLQSFYEECIDKDRGDESKEVAKCIHLIQP